MQNIAGVNVIALWKFVAENHTENFATLKFTLKNNIKEGSAIQITNPLMEE